MIRGIRNKRGDIPTMILVIGVFVICTLTLLSFHFVNTKKSNLYICVDAVEKASTYKEQIDYYKSVGLNPGDFLDGFSKPFVYNNINYDIDVNIKTNFNPRGSGCTAEVRYLDNQKQLCSVYYIIP